MTRKQNSLFQIVIVPFVVSASIEFLPSWLYLPICLIGAMIWLGACAILAESGEA